LPFLASTMPTVFSTAFPANATITKPANILLIPSVTIAGDSADTNQSDTKAEPTPATSSMSAAGTSEVAAGRSSAAVVVGSVRS
jgi:hypothetical protein